MPGDTLSRLSAGIGRWSRSAGIGPEIVSLAKNLALALDMSAHVCIVLVVRQSCTYRKDSMTKAWIRIYTVRAWGIGFRDQKGN